MVVSAVGMTVAFAGSAAAVSADDIASVDVTASEDTTNDVSTYTVDAQLNSSAVNSVGNITVSFDGGIDGSGTFTANNGVLADLDASNVSVEGSDQGSVSVANTVVDGGNDQVTLNLSSSTNFNADELVTIELANVTNPDSPATDNNLDVQINDGSVTDAERTTYDVNPSLDITDYDAPSVAYHGQVITVDTTITNQGATDAEGNVTVFADGQPAQSSVENVSTGTLSSGDSTTFSFDVNTTKLPDANATGTNTYNFGVNVTDTSTLVEEDSTSRTLTVGTQQEGTITANVQNSDGDDEGGADVRLYRAGSWTGDPATSTPIRTESLASGDSTHIFENLAVGNSSDDSSHVEYVLYADKAKFDSDSTQESLHYPDNAGPTRTLTLQRQVNAGDITEEQDSHSAIADGEDTIEIDVSVFDDNDSSPFGDAEVEVSVDATKDNSTVTVDPTDPDSSPFLGNTTQTISTDDNGTVTLEVSSTTEQEVEFNFTAASNDSVSVTATKNFVLAGEGSLQGHVLAEDTTNPIEGGSVWLARGDSYETNQQNLTINVTELANAYDDIDLSDAGVNGNTVYVRLVNASDQAVVPNQDYDIRENGSNADNIRKVASLNETDGRQGSGFAVIDDNNDDLITFNHTRIDPHDYNIDVSLTGENVSDSGVADGVTENFTRVTGIYTSNNTVTSFADPADITVPTDTVSSPTVFSPTADLTLENAIDRSKASDSGEIQGANFVDAPGFTNSFGEPTEGTNEDGGYALNQLPTDYQDGVQYVAIANAPGYSTDFQDVTVTEDGEYTFSEKQGSNDFQLKPVAVDPGYVNITNYGVHPPLAATDGEPNLDEVTSFDDMSDDVAQEVPRDGSVDVVLVETKTEGGPAGSLINATVDMSVPDDAPNSNEAYNFSGDVVDVLGGGIVDADADHVHTGDEFNAGGFDLGEGEALVLLETDNSGVDLDRVAELDSSGTNQAPTNETGVFAQLTADASATDFTNKSFVGVISFDSGSLEGRVGNSNAGLPNTVVWTNNFETANDQEFTIEPQANIEDLTEEEVLNSEFKVTDVDANESHLVTGDDLRDYRFENFTRVSVDPTFEGGFDLLTFPADGDESEDVDPGDYSLDFVPAQGDSGEDGVDYTRVKAIQFETGNSGSGTSANPVNVGFTQGAPVIITEATPISTNFEILNVEPSGDLDASANEAVSFNVTIENSGQLSGVQDVEFMLDGDVVASTTTAELESGVSTEVTLEVTAPADSGTYDWSVSTDDDSTDTWTLTVGDGDDDGLTGIAADYDTNDDGAIDITELGMASGDYANDEISITELGQVSGAYASS